MIKNGIASGAHHTARKERKMTKKNNKTEPIKADTSPAGGRVIQDEPPKGMGVLEVQRRKMNLMQGISNALGQFEQDTGVPVYAMRLERVHINPEDGGKTEITSRVIIDLRI